MTSRVPRLWQAVETPKIGRHQLPKNAAKFEVDIRMSRLDVRNYLERIYKLPVRDVRTYVEVGAITWESPNDKQYRTAVWKEEDKKYAYVYFKKDFIVEFADIFAVDHAKEEFDKSKKQMEEDANRKNHEFVNRNRANVGKLFGV